MCDDPKVDSTGQEQAQEQLRQNVSRLSLLLEGSEALSRSLNLPEVLQTLTEIATRLLDMGSGAIYLIRDEQIYLGATTPPLPPDFPEEARQGPLDQHLHIKEAVDRESPVILPDVRTAQLTDTERAISEMRNLRTVVYLPLKGSTGVLGVLIIATTDAPRAVSEAELTHCRTLGTQAAIAIENAYLYRSLQNELAERRQVESDLRASEALLGQSQEIASLGSWKLDLATRGLTWSGQTYRIVGLAPEEFSGTVEGFMEAVHPEDRARVLDTFFRSVDEGRSGYQIEHRIVQRHTGEVRYVHEKGIHQRNEAGEIVGSVGIVQDITERRLAEERISLLAQMSDNAPGSIMVHDTAGRILYANRRTMEMHGCSEDELMRGTLQSLRVSVDGKVDDSPISLDEGVDEANYEVLHRRKDGSTFPLQVHVKKTDWKGKPALLSIGTDISHLKRTEQALARAKDAAEAANRAKTEFLANMSHDLRTPLNGIMGMLQLLQGTNLDQEQTRFVSMALRSSERLTQLLSDLLDLSRIEAGKLEIRKGAFTIHELYESVLDLFGIAAEQKGIALDYAIDEALFSPLVGDVTRARQVLFNLVGNALKFTKEGGIRLEALPVPPKREGERRVRFSVSDTGVGIPEDELEQILPPLGRVAGGGGPGLAGTGLGLSIVRRLVEMLGGTLSISSRQGSGTTVSFELPFEPPGLSFVPQPSTTSRVEPTPRLRVLIAEDDELNRIVTQKLLEKEGHIVTSVEDGRQALDAFAAQDFDCIIMDIQMPVMDGVEATRAIREGKLTHAKSKVPIIALTAYAMREDQQRFLEAGVDQCLSKPVKVEKLRKALVRAAARHEP